jgi:hypothetical protein
MTDERPDNPNKVEVWGNFFAEYRRVRDSRGEEHLGVTLWRHRVSPEDKIEEREFHIEMDALERFASREVPEGCFAKPLDKKKPDLVERFKGYTAAFHAWTSPESGREIVTVHLTYAKEKAGERLDQEMWISHRAMKEFSAHGIAYEKELGLTKRWYAVVRVVGIGQPNGSAVVQTLNMVEDKQGERERARRKADVMPDEFLSQQPFRKPLEVGSEFTVDGRTESHLGNDKIRRAIIRLNAEEDLRRMQDLSQHELPRGYRQTL